MTRHEVAMAERKRSVVVTTTVAGRPATQMLAKLVVERRLAACAQYFPIRSVYWWKGKMEAAPEYLILMKTTAAGAARLARFIRKHHAYEVPEIVILPIAGGLPAYLSWIAAETRPSGSRDEN
jgi:periplasmic divalent cation tolerance protein